MRQMLFAGLLVLIPSFLYGQAPNRSTEVASIVTANASLLRVGGNIDDAKRTLLHVIVRDLNSRDGGSWGELLKTDQGGYVPADIIVWRPTMEHFDVLTDSGPMWGPHGVVSNPAWLWTMAPNTGTIPPPPGPQTPPPVVTQVVEIDYGRIRTEVQAAENRLSDQAERMFADLVARDEARAKQLEAHDSKPGMVSQTFGNRYVQMLLAGLGVFIEETMRR